MQDAYCQLSEVWISKSDVPIVGSGDSGSLGIRVPLYRFGSCLFPLWLPRCHVQAMVFVVFNFFCTAGCSAGRLFVKVSSGEFFPSAFTRAAGHVIAKARSSQLFGGPSRCLGVGR